MKNFLRSVPFFSTLDDSALDVLTQRLQARHIHKGASVFLASEPGDCMYIIRTGLVKIVSHYEGEDRFILYLGPGDFFGEGAALFGGLHSASVFVVLDADLLMLSHDDLTELMERYPAISLAIIRELHQRLRLSLRSPIQTKQLTVIASIGDATPVLAQHLAQVSGEDVLLVNLDEQSQPANAAALREDNVHLTRIDPTLNAGALPEYISQLIKQYYWVVLWAVPDETTMTRKAINQADLRVVLGTAFQQPVRRFVSDHLFADDNVAAIHQLTRQLARRQVGLALSSGNARGMAHIGVLKVLREEKIPLDLIAGTSAGALFGAMYAAGRTIEEITEFAHKVRIEYNFLTGFRNWDFSIPPRWGLIKGNMFLKQLQELLPGETFEGLKIPLAVVAADIVSGEEIIFDRGPLPEALRATMSMGGFLEPARHDGRLLIDGGAVNPVPAQVLSARGMNVIITSNVIPTLHERMRWQRGQLEKGASSLIDIMLNEREIMEGEIIRSRLNPVDVVIQPDVARYHVRQYDKAREIIQAGEDAARLQIPYIRKLLAPRPRKHPGA
jgi:NTE family protein